MAFLDDFFNASYPQNLEDRTGWTRVDGVAADAVISTLETGKLSAVSAGETAYRCTSQSTADHYTQVDVHGSCYSFICVRLTNSNNFIGFRHDGASWQVYKRNGGTFTQLGSDYTVALTPGDVAKLSAAGNTITFSVNGTARCLGAGVTESFNNTEQRQGIVARSSGSYPWIDNFEATAIGGGATITANLGTATAAGFIAAIAVSVTIACSLGGATASGHQATISTSSNVTINASLGSATASGHQASVASSGTATITTDVFKNNTGTVLASTTIPKLTALKLSDMTLAASWTNQTTNGSGVLTLAGAMTVATDYLLVVSSTDGASAGVKKYTAA